MSGREYKLIFTGPMGAGKTTAINAISQIPTVKTEVVNTDKVSHSKEETTVAMDYGEVKLPNGDRLRLYGTPGQVRFRFMWDILAKGALGVIVLLDNSATSSIDDMQDFLGAFEELVKTDRVIVGVGRMETHPTPTINEYCQRVGEAQIDVPIFSVDVRRSDDVLLMLDVLMHRIEAREVLEQLEAV
ncbi:MAG: ATP/GTP-binding protein [Wenzhouxiangellaceae bacterium]